MSQVGSGSVVLSHFERVIQGSHSLFLKLGLSLVSASDSPQDLLLVLFSLLLLGGVGLIQLVPLVILVYLANLILKLDVDVTFI